MSKIYSILVAYNPDVGILCDSVERLTLQTDFVVVCNNSDFSIELDMVKVKVFNFGENIGIAKAQSIGMKWAFENGADFILQMDQDSIPENGMVEKLMNSYELIDKLGYKIGIIGPRDYDKDTKEYSKALINKEKNIPNTSISMIPDILSSGSLIHKDVYVLVGGMDDDLFIDIVDFEYCWRMEKFGYLIFKDQEALLAHKLGDGKVKLFNFIDINIGSPFRHYYQFRNILYMMKRDYVPVYWKISQIVKLLLKFFIYPIGLKDGIIRFKYMRLGIKDFILEKKGKF
jgi:rhamnosyltransferase